MVDLSVYDKIVGYSQIPEQNRAAQFAVDQARREQEAMMRAEEMKRQQMMADEIYRQQQLGIQQQALNLREQGLGGNVPAALQLTNEYLRAKQEGDEERANAIAQFAKTQEAQLQFAQPIAEARAIGSAMGKTQGEAGGLLTEMQAYQPKLEQTVNKLSQLGKKATYTTVGRGIDLARRELGFSPRESAVARKEYISTVDNEILPLLRQTFGAAFTQKEGESLRATLGDVNASPEEKDAVLRAFIDNKTTQIEALKRQTGGLYQRGEQEFNNKKQGIEDPLGIR